MPLGEHGPRSESRAGDPTQPPPSRSSPCPCALSRATVLLTPSSPALFPSS
jgi:hypothetical protein